MGKSQSKVRKLNPKTMKDLQKNVDVDFSKDEIEQWFKEYQSSLTSGNSRLTQEEFRTVYNSVFDGDATDFVSHLFRFFDSNNDGYVDFKEFIVGLCISGSDKVDTKLRWAFTMYDIDGNGYITRDEMVDLLKAIFKMVDTNDGRMESDFATVIKLVREFFENADKNHDNKINREEFVGGAQDMPIILQLLQCDPGEGKLDYDPDLDPVNFDKLQISTAEEDKGQIKTSDDNTGTGTSSTDVSRSSAYQIN